MLINGLDIAISPNVAREVGNPIYYVKLPDCEVWATNY